MTTPALFLLCSFIWGTTWFAITWQLGSVAPEVSVAYRFGMASLLLLAWCAVTGRSLRFSLRNHMFVALQGTLMFGLSYIGIYWAEQHVPSGLAAVLFTTMVFMTPVGMHLAFREPFSRRLLFAAALGVTGVTCLFEPELRAARAGGSLALGIGMALLSAVFSTAGNLVAVRNNRAGLPVFPVTALGMAFGAATATVVAMAQGVPWTFDPGFRYVASILYLAVFGSIVAFGAYLTMLQRVGAGPSAFVTVSVPIIALLVSTLFEDYRWTPLAIAGAVIAASGNWLALRPGAQRRPPSHART